jgi:hypothetical protein
MIVAVMIDLTAKTTPRIVIDATDPSRSPRFRYITDDGESISYEPPPVDPKEENSSSWDADATTISADDSIEEFEDDIPCSTPPPPPPTPTESIFASSPGIGRFASYIKNYCLSPS